MKKSVSVYPLGQNDILGIFATFTFNRDLEIFTLCCIENNLGLISEIFCTVCSAQHVIMRYAQTVLI